MSNTPNSDRVSRIASLRAELRTNLPKLMTLHLARRIEAQKPVQLLREGGEPNTVYRTIELRRFETSDTTVQRAVARGARQSSDIVRFVNADEGYDALLFPADEHGHVTLRFVGFIPLTPIGLQVGDLSVEFVEPIDEAGFAVIRAEDVTPVLSGIAKLHVRIV